MRRLTTTSIWFSLPCFSFWNSVMSFCTAASPCSSSFCFLTCCSFSLRSTSMVFWNSVMRSSSSRRFSRRSHTFSYRPWSQPGGQTSSPASSSSSSSSPSSSSSSSSSLLYSSSSSAEAFFLLRLSRLWKIFASCSLKGSLSGTRVSNSAVTDALRAMRPSSSDFLASSLSLHSAILSRISCLSSSLACLFWISTTSRLSKSLSSISSW
mmetsp:Transcript_14016/g.30327  ORF Transcript_14016/g.30327 Transcript_14016/m.30327 type:complete len:209 (+) Transcript_14016:994-1620(+)